MSNPHQQRRTSPANATRAMQYCARACRHTTRTAMVGSPANPYAEFADDDDYTSMVANPRASFAAAPAPHCSTHTRSTAPDDVDTMLRGQPYDDTTHNYNSGGDDEPPPRPSRLSLGYACATIKRHLVSAVAARRGSRTSDSSDDTYTPTARGAHAHSAGGWEEPESPPMSPCMRTPTGTPWHSMPRPGPHDDGIDPDEDAAATRLSVDTVHCASCPFYTKPAISAAHSARPGELRGLASSGLTSSMTALPTHAVTLSCPPLPRRRNVADRRASLQDDCSSPPAPSPIAHIARLTQPPVAIHRRRFRHSTAAVAFQARMPRKAFLQVPPRSTLWMRTMSRSTHVGTTDRAFM